ncbi:MAG TPA: cytochrome c [Phaeodactylibacter sp.]|nr:cytochrome c [Phaeodactylibacter sp.]
MLKFRILIFLFSSVFILKNQTASNAWTEDAYLQDVLLNLGNKKPLHYLTPNPELAKKGEEIVKYGRTHSPKGKKTKYVSKYYVCTTCHNIEQEDPDLRFSNPDTRLPYVKKKGIPFLQGTTFKGIVNRESWYNDDYIKKYGEEKISKAHKNLRESIQLCAVECSQGRHMEDWEIEAVLSYFWTLQFKLSDLGVTSNDLKKLNTTTHPPENNKELTTWLKSFYLQKSPATFYDAPKSKKEGYPNTLPGDVNVGKDIYELSCLHCHKYGGVSHYELDHSKLSFRDIRRKITKNSHFSLYQIIPYGTYAIPGHRPYMPHYPLQRMSKQQVEDLRAYVELEAM